MWTMKHNENFAESGQICEKMEGKQENGSLHFLLFPADFTYSHKIKEFHKFLFLKEMLVFWQIFEIENDYK